jgi:dipeptidase E
VTGGRGRGSAEHRGEAAPVDGRTVLAMGGGGFTMDERSPALDRLALELASVPVPRVCFLPTASGDPREQVTRFYDRFGEWPCEPSILSLFHLARDRIDPVAHLMAQDVIYVGGGSMRNMLAIWREHSIDVAMRDAWASGTVLAGLSAGAMCWFEGGVSKSGGMPEAVPGIGLLSGSLSVHMNSEPERLPVYFEAVADGRLPAGFAVDDGAALVFGGSALRECVGSRPDARVLRVSPDADPAAGGGVTSAAMPVRVLPGAAGAVDGALGSLESHGVAELRELRAGPRRRWD